MVDYIAHHGIKGQKWGIRRFQNEDGSLTPEGKKRYNSDGTLTEYGVKKMTKKLKSGGRKVIAGRAVDYGGRAAFIAGGLTVVSSLLGGPIAAAVLSSASIATASGVGGMLIGPALEKIGKMQIASGTLMGAKDAKARKRLEDKQRDAQREIEKLVNEEKSIARQEERLQKQKEDLERRKANR